MSLTHTIALVSFLVLGCSARSVQLDDKVYAIIDEYQLVKFTWTNTGLPDEDDIMTACFDANDDLSSPAADSWQLVFSKDEDTDPTEVNVMGGPGSDTNCADFIMTPHKDTVTDGEIHVFEVLAIVTGESRAYLGAAKIPMNIEAASVASLVTATFNTGQPLYRLPTSEDTATCFFSDVPNVCYSDDVAVINSFSPCVAVTDNNTQAEVQVCSGAVTLSDTALDEAGATVTLDELQYPDADGGVAALLLTYTDGTAPVTAGRELVMVKADGTPSVYACTDQTQCNVTTFTAGEGLYSATVVGLDATDGTAASAATGTIQDILLEGVYKAPFFEFAFKNSNPDASPKYHAALASNSSVQATIDCSGITPGFICFGFLEVTDPAEGDRVRVDFLPDNTNVIQSALITTTEVPPQ